MRKVSCLVLLLLTSACLRGCSSESALPALTLRVLDERTKQPIPGVRVQYAIERVVLRRKFLGLVPPPDPTLAFKLTDRAAWETDARGEVVVPARRMRLPGDEKIMGEMLLVNVRVDHAHPVARTVLRIANEACRDGSPTCEGEPGDLDVAWHLSTGEDERREVLRAHRDGHRGVLLFVAPTPPDAPARQSETDAVVLRDVVSKRDAPEVVLVELRPEG